MIKKIDLYIIRKFLGTFFYAIALIVAIAVVFDISEKIDDFIDKKAPIKEIIFTYYLNFIPYFTNLFSSLFTFIAVIFFTSKMAANTEIVAILGSGVSFTRLLRPYFISALLLATLSFFLLNFVIPKANEKRLAFENTYLKNPYRYSATNIHRQIEPGVFVYFESFDNLSNTGYKFSIEHISKGELKYKLMADQAIYDTVKNNWRLQNFAIRNINGLKETLKKGAVLDTTFAFDPDEFGRRLNNIETMNFNELNKYIEEERMKGSDVIQFYELEKYNRIALPFSTFILTLIGVALSSRKVRGGIGLHLGIGIFIAFSYILFMQITNTFATYGGLSPKIAVWIPNITFGILGLYLLRTSPK